MPDSSLVNSPAPTAPKAFREFENIKTCPGCGSAQIQTAIEPDLGQCSACGLLFRNPRPTQAEIARSYDTGGTFSAWQDEEAARARRVCGNHRRLIAPEANEAGQCLRNCVAGVLR